MVRPLPLLATAALLTAAAVGVPVTLSDPAPEEPPEPYRPARLSDVAVTDLRLARAAFCERIDERAVDLALGGAPSATAHYGDGDPMPAEESTGQVANEFNCTYDASVGRARAWVFAPPVSPDEAERLLGDVDGSDDCEPVGIAGFGAPGVAATCRTPDGVTATYAGLVGDAWFRCTLTRADLVEPALLERADAWCAAALAAAAD